MSIYAFKLPQSDGQFHPTCFEGYFTPEECDLLISLYKDEQTWAGGVVDGDGSDREEDAIRRVDINTVRCDEQTQWLYDKLNQLVFDANQTYQFDLTGFMENMQLLNYSVPTENDPGGHYKVHADTGPSYLSTRKLSIVLQLTDPSEYEGCHLNVEAWGNMSQGRGDVNIFPSCMLHSVSELTEGKRQALVVWVNGPPFR